MFKKKYREDKFLTSPMVKSYLPVFLCYKVEENSKKALHAVEIKDRQKFYFSTLK